MSCLHDTHEYQSHAVKLGSESTHCPWAVEEKTTPVQSSFAGLSRWRPRNMLRLRPSRRHRAIPR